MDKLGYGFVSEECPTAAVGCRIKARSDHVEWYEWSKLYDRNQLVCVYPGEYEGTAVETTTTTERTTTTGRTKPPRPPTRKITHKKHSHKTTKTTPKTTTTALPLPTEAELGDTFDETRRRLNEEMREEDERLQQLLADEEVEMSRDEEDTTEEREEQRRRERERNRMERRERARADERRRLTEEATLRKHERAQKHREILPSSEELDEYDYMESSAATIYLISLSIFPFYMYLNCSNPFQSILHRLCTPCKWLVGMVKSLNEKSELLKAAAKIMCSIVTFNPPFCDASVKVISIGLDYATPETICSTIHLCAPPEHHGWFFMAKPSAGGLEKKTMEEFGTYTHT
ncbi:hypothetical protein ANCCEY_08568 [Ancylostoma ceylanicum]|uniref:Saposin B-type domain-containing protein n=1 Tax=Ancylostoma ceylanicum TaxID=53326 RepID=A0A0D6LQP8_9BILA|nr:hypothetical protein ANCCEY_08568 [Ancylostoma ceylanicum]